MVSKYVSSCCWLGQQIERLLSTNSFPQPWGNNMQLNHRCSREITVVIAEDMSIQGSATYLKCLIDHYFAHTFCPDGLIQQNKRTVDMMWEQSSLALANYSRMSGATESYCLIPRLLYCSFNYRGPIIPPGVSLISHDKDGMWLKLSVLQSDITSVGVYPEVCCLDQTNQPAQWTVPNGWYRFSSRDNFKMACNG